MYEYSLGVYEKAMPPELPLEDKLKSARAAGFDHMEFCIDLDPSRAARLEWSAAEIEDCRRLALCYGVPLTTCSLSVLRRTPLGMLDVAKNDEALRVLDRGAALAVALGSRVLLINGYDVYDEPSTEATRARYFENLPKAAAICARRGIIMAIENAEKPFCETVAQACEISSAAQSPYCCVYADIGNTANAFAGDADKAEKDLLSGRGKIAALHLKDSVPGNYRFTGYGHGHVDFARAAAAIQSIGVRIMTAELFYDKDTDYFAKMKEVNAFLRGFFA